jgi:hypothetical protein
MSGSEAPEACEPTINEEAERFRGLLKEHFEDFVAVANKEGKPWSITKGFLTGQGFKTLACDEGIGYLMKM